MNPISVSILILGYCVFILVLLKSLPNTKYRKDTIDTLKQIFIGAVGGGIVSIQFISVEQTTIVTGIYLIILAMVVYVVTRFYR
jgi:hypothetical protein